MKILKGIEVIERIARSLSLKFKRVSFDKNPKFLLYVQILVKKKNNLKKHVLNQGTSTNFGPTNISTPGSGLN